MWEERKQKEVMGTRLRGVDRQAVDRQLGIPEGVKFVTSEISGEKECPYKDLKKLKNAPLHVPELNMLVNDTEQDDTTKKSTPVMQPISEELEQDCTPQTPSLIFISESQYDSELEPKPFQVSCSEDWNQTNFLEPSLAVTNQTLPGIEKISQVPDLPPLKEEIDWLQNLKKEELASQPSEQLEEEPEDLFVSVQTKKFGKKPRISTVSREDLNYNLQHELKQLNHFVPNTVQYTTKLALGVFVHNLPHLKSGTHGCIVEEGYSPDGQEYMENIHFVTDKHLGSGSFGRVDLAIDSSSGKELVRKQIEKGQLQKGEIIIPLHLNSPHVTKVLGLIQRQTGEEVNMELLIEYAGRALNSYLIQDERTLTPEQIWILTKQALEGLAHIHNYGMIHLDIKPENLCIKEVNNSLELKITDFGSAKLPYDDITFNGWTPEYMAPECSQYFLQMMHGVTFGLRQEDITGKVDVFALFLVIGFMYGKKHVLLSLITHGRGNYHGMTAEQKKGLQTELIVMMATNGADVEALINDSCDLDMRELLKKMSKPMKDRVTAREALDIVEKREMFQQMLQRDRSLKLQHLQQQLQRQKRQEVHYTVPDLDKIGLPVTVMPEINCERSVVKDKLREKLLPYKKIQKLAEVPKTPLTPVEEMQKLQIKVSTSRTMQEQGHQNPRAHTFTEKQSFPVITETRKTQNMTPRPRTVPPRPQILVTSAVDTSQMPAPALLGIPTTTETSMEYDGFIDLKTQKPEKDGLQGNIPKIVFDF